MTEFNVIEEPWLPCVQMDGRTEELGIRAALARAHELSELAADTPPITLALHRLLLALLHRALDGPGSVDGWAALWEAGRFDMAPLNTYLERWRERFDLFDPRYPFYQTAGLPPERAAPSSRLRWQGDNNATLFDHTLAERPPALAPAEAARLVVAYQAFDTGGRIAGDSGGDSALAGPLLQPALTLVRGRSLFHTLLLNLTRYAPEDAQPWEYDRAADLPAWERGPVRPEQRPLVGYVDLLTWQGRRVLLLPDEDGAVRRAVLMKGWALPAGAGRHGHETMTAFARRRDAKPNEEAYMPLRFEEGRALWRDSLAFFQAGAQSGYDRPRSLSWLARLAEEEVIGGGDRLPVDVLGLRADQAKLLFWRHERLTVPLPYLNDAALRETLAEALSTAEQVGYALSGRPAGAVFVLGKELAGGDKTAAATVASLGIGGRYWAALDGPFAALLADLPGDGRDEDEPRPARDRWRTALRQAAHDAFAEGTSGLERSPRSMRAVALAARQLEWDLWRALGPARATETEPARTGGMV